MTPSGIRTVTNDAVALYFADAAIASAFVVGWCARHRVEVADGLFRVREDEPTPRVGAADHTLSPEPGISGTRQRQAQRSGRTRPARKELRSSDPVGRWLEFPGRNCGWSAKRSWGPFSPSVRRRQYGSGVGDGRVAPARYFSSVFNARLPTLARETGLEQDGRKSGRNWLSATAT
jgi:hypothetical protein